jgi:type III restriction enzyme
LRILEELHFHSPDEHRYIAELKTALVSEGLIDDKTEEKELLLKDSFKKTSFYKKGSIYLNKYTEKNYSAVKSFADLGINATDFKFEIASLRGSETRVLTDDKDDKSNIQKEIKTITISEIDEHIILNAMQKNDFFKFDNVKRYIPSLDSIKTLAQKKEYLGSSSIQFICSKDELNYLPNKYKMQAVLLVLNEVENRIKGNTVQYEGVKEFVASRISEVFTDKKIKLEIGSERAKGHQEYVKDKE